MAVIQADAVHVATGSAYLVAQSIIFALIGALAFAFVARILTQVQMRIVVAITLTATATQIISNLGFGKSWGAITMLVVVGLVEQMYFSIYLLPVY